MQNLPTNLYTSLGVKQLDQLATQKPGQDAYTLMSRAGLAAFTLSKSLWPQAKKIAVFCGSGNNGGDGFVFACLARAQGLEVVVYQVGEVELDRLSDATRQARNQWLSLQQPILKAEEASWEVDLVVDAILGTGLHAPLGDAYQQIIQSINVEANEIPVLAIDLPSGLDGTTGNVIDCAVNADATISFLGLKVGLLSGEAYDYVGDLFFDDLAVDKSVLEQVESIAKRYIYDDIVHLIPKIKRTVHKGNNGHVLIVGGGELHYSGAPLLSAEAAYRSGAGLVSVFIPPESLPLMARAGIETMIYASENLKQLDTLIEKADAVLIGPGLGQNAWSHQVFNVLMACKKPLVVDADALNLLAQNPCSHHHWVLTPHPGEAARLLNKTVQAIQLDRIQSIRELVQKYNGTVVLKGAGTLIGAQDELPLLYAEAIPLLATAGTGDILAGLIVGLVSQGMQPLDAATLAVAVHGQAGKEEMLLGDRGMIASDLFLHIRALLSAQPNG